MRDLLALERLRLQYGPQALARKRVLLQRLGAATLPSAGAVRRLHEMLCFLRAYPDDAELRTLVVAQLEAFAGRDDLRRHRQTLAASGIAGTDIPYRFFAGQAHWLARHWPAQLRLDRDDPDTEARVARALPQLLTPLERHALRELGRPGYAALDRLRPGTETDATFLLRRVQQLAGDSYAREEFVDAMDAAMVLTASPDTPSRTRASFAPAPVVYRNAPPSRQRPDLREQIRRPPRRVRRLPPPEGQALVDLACAAMVNRARSLETFSFGDARDAWLVDDGDGLAFGFCGVLPERRHALATLVGGLILRNGVPVGYLQADIVGSSAALSFNTFETFRGGEAAFLLARWLAALHRLYGCTAFSIEPYQLGRDNDEALDSAAWWFYARLGFAPRRPDLLEISRREQARMARSPGHRSSRNTLERLAQDHLFLDLDPGDPQPLADLSELGLQCGAALSALGCADREAALASIGAEAVRRAGLARPPAFTPCQRVAWLRLLPLLGVLDTRDWRARDYREWMALARAKAGRSERPFVKAVQGHAALTASLRSWALKLASEKASPTRRR